MTDLCQVPACGKPATYHSFPANAPHPDEGMATCDAHLSEGMSHLPGQPAPEHWRVFPLHDGSPPYCAVTCSTCHPPIHIARIEVQSDDPDRMAFGLAPLIDGLTPEQCRERWLANRSEQEVPCGAAGAMHDLTPAQIEVGKCYRRIQDAISESLDRSVLRVLVKTSDAERKAREPRVLVDPREPIDMEDE